MQTKAANRARRFVAMGLIATTIGLFAATGMLYMEQSRQREMLAVSVRTSGWVAYQAQIEYVKAMAALTVAREKPSPHMIEDLSLRLEILLSRLPILYRSEEGRLIVGIEEFEPIAKTFEKRISSYIDYLQALPPDPGPAKTMFGRWQEALEPLGEQLQGILETSVVYNEEIYRRERELASNPATVPLSLMFMSGGGLVFLLGVQAHRDRRTLEDVLRARQAQAEVEANFREAMDVMPIAVIIFDPETERPSFVNPGALEIVGRQRSDAEWHRLIRTVTAWERRDGEQVGFMDLPFAMADGRMVSLRGAITDCVWDGRRQRMLAMRDVTKLRDAELQVMQAAKLATLGEMATAIAHEANQPLAVIKMAAANARRLVDAGETGEAVGSKLQRISEQVDRIKRITDQVRRYGRMASRQQERFSPQEAIGLAASFLAEQYRASGVRLELEIDLPPDTHLAGEQIMFEQVIVNLLTNARDAMESAVHSPELPLVTVTAKLHGTDVVVQVADNAGGIAPDILPHIFEPFLTTKSADKGTGLGLSMARNIILDMAGEIGAENVGAGACFTIRIPAASAADHDATRLVEAA